MRRKTVEEIVERAFVHCDANKDGKLSYQEFKQWTAQNHYIVEVRC